MREVFYNLFNLDIKTLLAVLFFGNITSAIVIFIYMFIYRKPDSISENNSRNIVEPDGKSINKLGVARFIQAISCFLMFARDIISDFLSVNIGITACLIGFYIEVLIIFELTRFTKKWVINIEKFIVIILILLLNLFEWLNILNPADRVIFVSVSIFVMFLVPTVNLLMSKSIDKFDRAMGFFYGFMLMGLIPRVVYFIKYNCEADVFIPSVVQTLTHLSIILIMIFGLTSYMLLFSKKATKAAASMASLDYLTELPNRYSFLANSKYVVSEHRDAGRNLSVLFIDIDRFKKVNDTYGHAFGDEVLVKFSNVLTGSVRSTDFCCRYGGEEFLVILTDTDIIGAKSFGERIMQKVSGLEFEKQPGFSFTVSIGISILDAGSDKNLDKYIDMADKALYHSKQTGRNKISVYGIDIKEE